VGARAAEYPAAAHVFVSDVEANELTIAGGDGHHLARVRRLHAGEFVTAADGRGRWRPYVVAGSGAGRLRLDAAGDATAEPVLVPRVAVAFALTKGDKPESVVRAVTELGVDRILPVRSVRSATRRDSRRLVQRLRRVAREASAQCRRASLPEVGDVTPLLDVATAPGLVLADRGGGAPDHVPLPPDGEWVVLIGPEGGFDPRERAALGVPPRLAIGPNVLRAETAATAVVAALAPRRHSSGSDDHSS
jgi:16S rRNA (uracil1498-N3)-methyltransferase